ncbi:MAG: tail fiber domain-containing protein [Chitinophagaceae bacterium]|nr:tail fiber domain-containing protein [Chitinophagaceae bacterium]
MGEITTASGFATTAMGNNTTASGDYTFAAGTKVSTNNHAGAFFFGDSDPHTKGVRNIGINDQFAARFNGGYYFISDDAGADIGVQVLPGGNAWVAICDKNRKENFEPLNGDDVLQKIARINFTSWNYKMQDAKKYRHYGIMAQDFYNAFGHDKYGTIGNDTTVNPIDMIGIDMTAIQALEKRTSTLDSENKDLRNEIAELKTRLMKLEKLNR